MHPFQTFWQTYGHNLRGSLFAAVVLVALLYALIFVLVGGQIDVPFLYSNPGR
ncbi:hypothetical protein [Methylocella sp. CPCC 101449]|uniref:hypothetical protein n=1 Tax=Methylocella sp. CPCC 101449 TaxID=2987531 RepID=UPI001AC01E1C|nr:hypothetical protein [Methylocella sp. CPCC 101449]MBN9080680.1 hypothetical protein [Hyphomicrobiales bacterium]MDT2020355.1 hypothetical protein [Methylocella sp. CPCC 101449]HEV2574705.1 hypothetical protein [Beijerinckiaceae bacterium]